MDLVRVTLIFFTFVFEESAAKVKLNQDIVAVGFPYYKMMFSVGTCKERVLFDEELIWKVVKLNRILDVYYESSNTAIIVSKAEIYLVINNTDCFAFSETGIGRHKFTAVVFLPTKISIMFYHLILYTCSQPTPATTENLNNFDVDSKQTEQPGVGPDGDYIQLKFKNDEN